MITALNILVLTLSSFLTLSFLPHFKILGATAILPLFFIIQLAYFRKGFEPLLLSALTGIFFDIFSPYFFGFYLLWFLLTAVFVRYFFDEGLRGLSFWHYILAVSLSLGAFYLTQIGVLLYGGSAIQFTAIYPILIGLAVNVGFSILYFVFGEWYFEWILTVEDRLKRR